MMTNNKYPISARTLRLFCLKTLVLIGVYIFAANVSPAFARESALIVAAANPSTSSSAETKRAWPSRPIKYIVPFPPGGFADSMARVLSPALTNVFQQPVMIENRPGGNAMIGYAAVAESPADGYTWLAITLTHAINQSLFANKWVKLNTGFTPVALLATSPLVVVVHPDVNAKTLAELAALAKQNSQKDTMMSAGSSGNGTPPHLGLTLLEEAFAADIVHIPYKGGVPSVVDLLSHQIDMIVANLPEVLPHIKSGKLRALAVTSTKRSAFLPGVPTTTEEGYPNVVIENWTGILVPANTPRAITSQIVAEVNKIMAANETQMRLETIGFMPQVLSGDALNVFLNREVSRWGKLVRDKNIQPE